jgi:flagellar basal-body rod protein FlgC
MNFLNSLNISASGLTAQRLRMNVINSNLANMHTTRTAEGGPYVRKDVVFSAKSAASGFNDVLQDQLSDGLNGVKVVGVINDEKPPLLKFDPNHPDADEKGYVRLPNINLMEEMVNLMSASRSYEANVTAIKATKSMANKALEIGR